MIELFLLLGIIILIGFFSSVLFERTRIPDVLILLLFGIMLGPVTGVIDPNYFVSWAPFIGTLALIIILWDGGLNLNIFQVFGRLPETLSFTVLVFVLGASFTAVVLHYVFGWQLLHALLLGVIVGGPSSVIVMPMVSQLPVGEEVKTLLSLESALTDVLCIVVAVALIQVIKLNLFDVGEAAHNIASAFAIAAVIGVVFGMLWIGILRKFYGKPFGYVVTLAVIFIMYAFVEAIRGSGAIAVLAFALVVGNAKELTEMFRMKGDFRLDTSIKKVQTEISFFVKTFFFVYLGIIFNLGILTLGTIALAVGALLALIAARFIGTKALTALRPNLKKYSTLITATMPRGLAAAVLALAPAYEGIQIPLLAETAFLLILLTAIVATIGTFSFESEKGQVREAGEPFKEAKATQPANTAGKKPRIVK